MGGNQGSPRAFLWPVFRGGPTLSNTNPAFPNLMFLAELSSSGGQPTSATFGVIVIVLLQLAQFFFAWRKDQSREASAKKEDLAALKKELREEINKVDGKVEKMREASDEWREKIKSEIGALAVETASLATGQDLMNQTLNSLLSKFDAFASRKSS